MVFFRNVNKFPDYVGLIQMPYGNIGRMKSWGADGNMEFLSTDREGCTCDIT